MKVDIRDEYSFSLIDSTVRSRRRTRTELIAAK
jgi:hypothetical protein